MWGWTFLVLAAAFAWQTRRVGPRLALGQVTFLALLVPAWAYLGYQSAGIELQFTGVPVDAKTAIGFVGLLVCATRPRQLFAWRLTWVDLAVALMAVVHVLADWRADGLSAMPLLRAFGEWVLPYAVGRATIQSVDDLRALLPVAIAVTLALAAVAGFEALLRVNAFEWAYGNRPIEYMPRHMSRWGLKRAYGPAKHPIFLGMMLLMLTPWAIYAASYARRGRWASWWIWTPVAVVFGIVFTVSRGPIIGVAVALAVAVYLLFPRLRKPLWGVAGVIVAVLLLQPRAVLETLHMSSGESKWRRTRQVEIDGEMKRFSGTEARLYLFDVYGEALRRAGLLGFGTEAVTGFPVNVPVGPENVETLKSVRFIDNIYVLTTLRFGYLGLVALVTLLGASIVDWWRRTTAARGAPAFCAGATGALAGAAIVMLTVWMPHDFGFLILWTAGAGSGLRAGE